MAYIVPRIVLMEKEASRLRIQKPVFSEKTGF
jgi:hypothetical protein